MGYSIHPKVGIARLGNSHKRFLIAPEKTGGLPMACNEHGDLLPLGGAPTYVNEFRDSIGAILRQAARFQVYRHDKQGQLEPVTLASRDIKKVVWTVHLANKKAMWYEFSELKGNLEFGADNSYAKRRVPRRNASTTDTTGRRKLMIDPGPRQVWTPAGPSVAFSRDTQPARYRHASFPPDTLQPSIDSLGEIRMDSEGRLIVLGGFGKSAGTGSIDAYGGADGWWDDVSDGYVAATLHFSNGRKEDLEPAWVIVGSPKYAPELVNIVTLDDTVHDMAVRHLDFNPDLFSPVNPSATPGRRYDPRRGFNQAFEPDFNRDILPLMQRMDGYRWVANIPAMQAFARPPFDPRDKSLANRSARRAYFKRFRVPVPPEAYATNGDMDRGPNALTHKGQLLMPLNSGDNSVHNEIVYKFLTLTPTQYFMLSQWSKGKFTNSTTTADTDLGKGAAADLLPLDREVLGNLVGAPLCPGVETTWIVRDPKLYKRPFVYDVAHWNGSLTHLMHHYQSRGLSLTSDPQTGGGAEPGDLTKRMAVPWQADFFDCMVQTPNVSDRAVNELPNDIPLPPVYYVHWWPPQSPMDVISGEMEPGNQVLDGYVSATTMQLTAPGNAFVNLQVGGSVYLTAAGQQMPYARGVSSHTQMASAWKDLGFIVNQGTQDYPDYVEKQRNVVSLAQGSPNAKD